MTPSFTEIGRRPICGDTRKEFFAVRSWRVVSWESVCADEVEGSAVMRSLGAECVADVFK